MKQNKFNDKFNFGITLVVLSIAITMLAFISEENKITGYAATELSSDIDLPVFQDINALSTLSPGKYYINDNGIVNMISDESSFPVAKFIQFDENKKNVPIYIDREGRVGYILEIVENG